MIRKAGLLLLLLAVAGSAGATAQAPDILKIGDQTYSIYTNPLQPFLEANPKLLPESEVTSSGLWRGYIATWVVRDGRLFVEDVRVLTKAAMDPDAPESKQYRSVMKELFGNASPRVATWFTGHLIVPKGEVVDYVHMGYASTWSSYLVVTVVKGEIQAQREMNRDQFEELRRAQFAAFKKTPEYARVLEKTMTYDDPMPADEAEQFLFEVMSEEYMSRIFEGSGR